MVIITPFVPEDNDAHQINQASEESLYAPIILPNSTLRPNPVPRSTHVNPMPIQAIGSSANGLVQASGSTKPSVRPLVIALPAAQNMIHKPKTKTRTRASSSRPKGRPRGSKNKHKEAIMNFDNTGGFSVTLHALEIPKEANIVEMIQKFSDSQKCGITIHCGVGRIKDVTIQTPGDNEPNSYREGTYELVNIKGFHVGAASAKQPEKPFGPVTGPISYPGRARSSIAVVLNGPEEVGLFGGQIMGPLMAASTIVLYVTTFDSYEFHSLIPEVHDQARHPDASGPGPSGVAQGPNPNPMV